MMELAVSMACMAVLALAATVSFQMYISIIKKSKAEAHLLRRSQSLLEYVVNETRRVGGQGAPALASVYIENDCGPRNGESTRRPYTHARCRIDVDGVLLNLVTTHFESPRVGLNAARREGFDGLDDWRRNVDERLAQARTLAIDLAGVARPLVVAGDLNAPETSPVIGTLLRSGLRDAFSSAGRGYGYSYGHALRVGVSFLRIDHVLVSPEIGVATSFVGAPEASDHRPVIADLLLPPR